MSPSFLLAAALVAAAFCGQAPKTRDAAEACSGEYGTAMTFEKSPSDAARKAIKEEKLVIVFHVSGNFEDPAFT